MLKLDSGMPGCPSGAVKWSTCGFTRCCPPNLLSSELRMALYFPESGVPTCRAGSCGVSQAAAECCAECRADCKSGPVPSGPCSCRLLQMWACALRPGSHRWWRLSLQVVQLRLMQTRACASQVMRQLQTARDWPSQVLQLQGWASALKSSSCSLQSTASALIPRGQQAGRGLCLQVMQNKGVLHACISSSRRLSGLLTL